jgi:hypothetical protein
MTKPTPRQKQGLALVEQNLAHAVEILREDRSRLDRIIEDLSLVLAVAKENPWRELEPDEIDELLHWHIMAAGLAMLRMRIDDADEHRGN